MPMRQKIACETINFITVALCSIIIIIMHDRIEPQIISSKPLLRPDRHADLKVWTGIQNSLQLLRFLTGESIIASSVFALVTQPIDNEYLLFNIHCQPAGVTRVNIELAMRDTELIAWIISEALFKIRTEMTLYHVVRNIWRRKLSQIWWLNCYPQKFSLEPASQRWLCAITCSTCTLYMYVKSVATCKLGS